MTKKYSIELDGKLIGFSFLEKADAPMGLVFGKIIFEDISSGYDFFRDYCLNAGIELNSDFPEERLIATRNIPGMKVISENGNEIKGLATSVDGMDADCFEITLAGVPYPFYAEEFPHHLSAEESRFGN